MIGTILSLHYVGKKKWIPSIIFWVGYLIITAVISGLLYTVLPTASFLGIVIGFGAFMILAHYWYKYDWRMSFKLFVVAFIIDFVIAIIIVAILAIAIADFWVTLFPQASLL